MSKMENALLLTLKQALLGFHIETACDSVSVLKEERAPMLPPFIIEQIRKREIEERAHQEQPRLELPLDPRPAPAKAPVDEEKRGVIIVEL